MKFPSVFKSKLAKTTFFRSVPGNLLLIPLDILADFKFSCPCNHSWNIGITVLVFIAPALLVFALTLLGLLKPKEKQEMGNNQGNQERARGDDNAEEKVNKWVYVLISLCTIFMWVILLLIDGDYVACSNTNWEGQYTYDDKLQRKWCKPTELMLGEYETELQNQILLYIRYSQLAGYIILFVLSIILMVVACIYCNNVKQTRNSLSEEENGLRPNH
ncbi:hypothetical protein G5714_004581 [Onychostoma macrolepis]|uniref:Uncharacterized protein n=1 Tax=Onychostoma macrolepis TaxID=369639 RepID=A0A7J6D523_9TELE|nr:hypothetical protein G5714_004581 [Onychostoma macrolepis]